MLNKQYRLPASTRLNNATLYSTALFSLKVAANNLPESRFGFVIGKAVDKRAVVRNRIRRLFRSCIEDMREEIVSGHDMLFFLKRGIIEKEKEVLSAELANFLKEKTLLV